MIELKDMQLLLALSRHKHFARAADEVGMSQPAFSMRLRSLEGRLGLSIVRRGNRFQGLTDEGEMIVERARGILGDARALEQDIAAARGQVTGTLDLGVVPTATSYAARLVALLQDMHPHVLARIHVTTSASIQSWLLDGTIDAGLTYVDSIEQEMVTRKPLYHETYVLLAPLELLPDERESMTWTEAAELPLSLLVPSMQNRRILDMFFAEQGAKPRVLSESNGFMSAIVMVREGRVATILPQALTEALGPLEGTRAVVLQDPEPLRQICLTSLTRQADLRLLKALNEAVDAFV